MFHWISCCGTLMPRTHLRIHLLPLQAYFRHFSIQAASTQQHSFGSPDVSPTVGACPRSSISHPPGEYRQLRQQHTEQKFLLWWCLHHLKSLPVPPPSAGGEFDLALRRVLRQTAIAPPQFDENSPFKDIVTKLYDMHVGTVTKFP